MKWSEQNDLLKAFSAIPPVCPNCGRLARQTETQYGLRSQCCGLWSWDGKPLVDEGTHRARKAAHASFDPLWKDGHMSRKEAYRWLRRTLGLAYVPHMADMDTLTAARVVAACKSFYARA